MDEKLHDERGLPTASVSDGARNSKRVRSIFYYPTRQNHTVPAVLVGLACRALVAAMFVSGMCLFIADSISVIPGRASMLDIFLPSLFFTFSLTVVVRGRKFAPIGVVALAGGVLLRAVLISSDIVSVLKGAVASIHNAVIDKFMYAGLTSVYRFAVEPVSVDGAASEDLYAMGLALLALLLSLVFVPMITGRFSALALSLASAIFTVPCFLYNIMSGNWGFALLVSALTGVVVLYIHDRAYTVQTKKKHLIAGDIAASDLDDPEIAAKRLKAKRKAERKERRAQRAAEKRKWTKGKGAGLVRLESSADRRRRLKEERRARRLREREEDRALKKLRKERCDRERPDKKTLRESTALGGTAGLCAAVIAMLLAALPASFVTDSNPNIPYITDIISNARKYVTAFLSSESIDLNNISSLGMTTDNTGPRPTNALYPKYNNITVATVETPYGSPVYLRSWVGVDYYDNKWYSAGMDAVDSYRKMFGETFSPEMITENFYSSMYPAYVMETPSSAYVDNTRLGFILERVSVTRKYPTSSALLYIPSVIRPSKGLISYDSQSKSIMPYRPYFDGIWTSKYFFEGAKYVTESMVTTMRYPELGNVMGSSVGQYLDTVELINSGGPDDMLALSEAEKLGYIEDFKSGKYWGADISSEQTLLYKYLCVMTQKERESFKASAKTEEEYASYVQNVYLTTDDRDSAEIYKLAVGALKDKGVALSPDSGAYDAEWLHGVVMALVDYLGEECRYSTDNNKISPPTGNETGDSGLYGGNSPAATAVLRFLTETKRGYCVQFASSLALMLRSLGIPARYCEGFIASEFTRSRDNLDAAHRYSVDILDSDAHAWVEVYYRGMGWVTYEATPTYKNGMYGEMMPEMNTGSTDIPSIESTLPPPAVNNEDVDTEEDDANARLIRIAVFTAFGILAVSAVSLIVYFIVLRSLSRRETDARIRLTTRLCAEEAIPPDELRRDAHDLCVRILELYKALGIAPRPGELHGEYAKRVEKSLGDATGKRVGVMIEYVLKEQFGHSLTRDEAALLADYYDELTKTVYEGLSPFDKFNLRYRKRLL